MFLGNLVLSTGHRKEIRKLTFRALAFESLNVLSSHLENVLSLAHDFYANVIFQIGAVYCCTIKIYK